MKIMFLCRFDLGHNVANAGDTAEMAEVDAMPLIAAGKLRRMPDDTPSRRNYRVEDWDGCAPTSQERKEVKRAQIEAPE